MYRVIQVIGVLVLSFITIDVEAAQFELQRAKTPGGPDMLFVSGEFLYGDDKIFISDSSNLSAGTIIILSSPGGNLVAGIEMGREIRKRAFATVAADLCASSCALAWLGGTTRYMERNSKVGFHVAFKEGAVSQESGTGNALVGLYAGELGFKDNVIRYITEAAPDEMQWLTVRDAQLLGIEVQTFSLDAPQADNVAPSASTAISPVTDNTEGSRQFVMKLIETNSGSSDLAIKIVQSLYASSVSYYGKQLSIAEVIIDKTKYFSRWPVRFAKTRSETVETKCEAAVCYVTGIYDWQVANPAKHKNLQGSATFEYGVLMQPDISVFWEGGKVISK